VAAYTRIFSLKPHMIPQRNIVCGGGQSQFGNAPASRCQAWDFGDASWLITMSDLTLLLLCFLAVWYFKQQPPHRIREEPRATTNAKRESSHISDGAAAGARHWAALKEEMRAIAIETGLREDIEIEIEANEVRFSFKDSIAFASGKADLNVRAFPLLKKISAVAVREPALHLRIDGHTDDRPISTSEFPSNWELSSARASRVARRLIEEGVDPARIEVNGYADYRPRAENAGRGANRRVEISLLRKSINEKAVAAELAITP
jgi:outer membrane protein OmpA-like peptidoglycan-associated protein